MNRFRTKMRNLFDQVRLRPAFHDRLAYWVYGPEFRRWCGLHPCETLSDRTDMYRFLLEHEQLDGPIDYLEFGVSQGLSIRWWVENNQHADSTFVGFDTFEGLPEDWIAWPRGAFSTNGEAPMITDGRCAFVKGLFQDTVPRWLAGREFTRRTVAHFDADLYTSTLVVLTQILPKLKPDDVILFDQFSSYFHEYRAFIDATTAYHRQFDPICCTGLCDRIAMKAI
jgi:O-methyltransferase